MTMSLGDKLIAQDFINLKARVKAEMNRRNGYGSLTSYGTSTGDFTVVPAAGTSIKEEHYDKIRDYVANINTTNLPPSKGVGNIVVAMNTIDTQLALYEAKSISSRTGNDCAGLCSGTCISECTNACTGCGSCGGCDTTCNSSCSTCAVGCSTCTGCGSCGGCDTTCNSSCSTCAVGCSTCTSCTGCDNGCQGDCKGTCSTCAYECNGDCTSACSSTCGSGCQKTCNLEANCGSI